MPPSPFGWFDLIDVSLQKSTDLTKLINVVWLEFCWREIKRKGKVSLRKETLMKFDGDCLSATDMEGGEKLLSYKISKMSTLEYQLRFAVRKIKLRFDE